MPVWYRVRDLDAGRAFYRDKLGFDETYVDWDGRWARLERSGMEIALAEGEPEEGGVAHAGRRGARTWGRGGGPGPAGAGAVGRRGRAGPGWYPRFPEREAGWGFGDETPPEVTLAVVPARRGRGLGKEMLEALLDQARR